MVNASILKGDDFGGGLITKNSEINLQPSETPDCLNVHSDIFKSLSKRLGYAKLSSVSQAASCNGLYNYIRTETEEHIISLWSSSLFNMDISGTAWTGTWAAIAKDSNKGTTLTDYFMYNTTFKGDVIIANEGRCVMQKYNPNINAKYVDIDWETSHGRIIGNSTTFTGAGGDKIKITLDGSHVFDNIDLSSCSTIALVVAAINAVSTFSAYGLAYADATGYLNIMSNLRGGATLAKVENGSTQSGPSTVAKLFNTATVETAQFSGGGLNDMTSGGTTSVTETTYYKVQIDSTGTTDTFKWSNDNGVTFVAANVAITQSAQTLEKGVTVTFAAKTGHTVDDFWQFYVDPSETVSVAIIAYIAPQAKYVTNWTNYLWAANVAADSDRIYRSELYDHTSWLGNYYIIPTPGDVGITALATLRGKMYIFKKFSIHRVTFLGGNPLIDIKQIKTSIGTASPRTIVNLETPDNGEVIIFLGTDLQLYMFDGNDTIPISEKISTYNGISNYCMFSTATTNGINAATLNKCHAVNYTKRHWYVLYFCLGNATTPTDALVYDYYAKSFWAFHFANGFTCSMLSDNGAGQRLMYTAGVNYSWLMDSGNSDDSATINGYYSTGKIDFGEEIQKKELRSLNVTMNNAAVTPLIQYRCDWESSFNAGSTLAANKAESTIDLPRFEELLQWKISETSTNPSWQLLRASIAAKPRGIAK
jgi:hypothetical protein